MFLGQSLCAVIVMNGVLAILKGYKWIWMFSDDPLSPQFYFLGTVVLSLASIITMDVLTALEEVRERSESRDLMDRACTENDH